MKQAPRRLPADAPHGFGGTAIERGKVLTFRLNGRSYQGYAGDTVLSALLGAGVDTAGTHHGEAIALDERFCPPVIRTDRRDDAGALPMQRTPLVDGLDLTTFGPSQNRFRPMGLAARIGSMFGGPPRSLGHRLDDPRAFGGPWLRLAPARTIEADTVVVGAGVAGMSAALAAADAGGRVVLIERNASMGGDAAFFGAVGDEAPPETRIAGLADRVRQTPSITVLLRAEAVELTGLQVRLCQVELVDGRPESRTLIVSGQRIVIATGMSERLPVFAGNRMPGVATAISAFKLASGYGVWRGQRTLFSTSHSYSYRLALRAADAGIRVQRVTDARHSPQSRYIDFCKASGLTLASSLLPRSVEMRGGRDAALAVSFAVAVEDEGLETEAFETDRFVVSGSRQPRIALWLMAGGGCVWMADRSWIGATGVLDSIALAGSAAGYRTTKACLESGESAVKALVARKPPPDVDDIEAGAIYESRDGSTPIAPWRAGRHGTFLDGGATFVTRPSPIGKPAPAFAPAHVGALRLGDVAAAVELGAITEEDAGIVAGERCGAGEDIVGGAWMVPDSRPAPHGPPAYLRGRFGPKPATVIVAGPDERSFEVGCLLFSSSDQTGPMQALGVVMAPAPTGQTGGLALVDRAALASPALYVLDVGGMVPIRIVGP